ncbi:MAG: hypothetical protein ACI30R_10655 [Sodaliphilus sp.]
MASTYGELLLTVYELEGLLLVLEKHGADTPASVIQLIKEKAASVALQAEHVQLPEQSPEEEMLDAALNAPDEEAEVSQPEPAEEPKSQPEPLDDDVPPEFSKCPACGKVLPANYTFCNECGALLADEPLEPAEPEKELEVPIEEDAEFVAPESISEEPEEEEEVFEEVETEEEEEIFDDDDDDDDDAPLSVQEKLNRDLAKNLRSSFTLNDSIRFRRELFGNSQAEYNDALDMILTMHSFGEVEEYFYDDLGWDPMNEDVMAFMEVVHNFFR